MQRGGSNFTAEFVSDATVVAGGLGAGVTLAKVNYAMLKAGVRSLSSNLAGEVGATAGKAIRDVALAERVAYTSNSMAAAAAAGYVSQSISQPPSGSGWHPRELIPFRNFKSNLQQAGQACPM